MCFGLCVFLLGSVFFFFNDPATTEIYTLSLHDALPIYDPIVNASRGCEILRKLRMTRVVVVRSEEHTSELQSPMYLVCRLLLEKKKKKKKGTFRGEKRMLWYRGSGFAPTMMNDSTRELC